MSNENVIDFKTINDLISPVAVKEAMQREGVSLGIYQIDENLTDKTVHILRRAVLKWATSPQMLCILTNGELAWFLESIEMERNFRQQERQA